MTSPWVSKEDINLLTFLLIIDTFLRSKQYLKSVLKQTYWDYYHIIWSRMHDRISQLLTKKPKKRSFTRRRLRDCAPCSWRGKVQESPEIKKLRYMISWPIWIELRSFLHPNLQRYCQEKLLFHSLFEKKSNLIKQKEPFWGEGAGIPLPPPPPNPWVLQHCTRAPSKNCVSSCHLCVFPVFHF